LDFPTVALLDFPAVALLPRIGNHAAHDDKGSGKLNPRQWTPHATLKLAFARHSLPAGLPTRRYLDARAVAVHAALDAQDRQAKVSLADDAAAWLFIERCFDETPLHVDFGHLAEQIAPLARYFVPCAAQRFRAHVRKLAA
jgi:hypothetical protein